MESNSIRNNIDMKMLQITPGTIFFTEFAGFTGDKQDNDGWLHSIGIPNPSTIDWEGTVLTNEEKNAKGDVFLEYVNKKRKLTIGWDFLTQTEYRKLLGHLSVDFNNKEQAVLYYRVKAFNPNTSSFYLDNGVLQPRLDEMVATLDGKYVGKVKICAAPQSVEVTDENGSTTSDLSLTIGYEGVKLVFTER